MDLISKGSNVACVLVCGGLWFANGKFGCTWKLVQAIVKPKASMRGKCMIQLSPQEQATLESQEDAEDESEGVADATAGVLVDDSDEDEDEAEAEADGEAEVAPPVAPVQTFSASKKKVTKKRVRKKSAGAS